jgi:hypothetical protein
MPTRLELVTLETHEIKKNEAFKQDSCLREAIVVFYFFKSTCVLFLSYFVQKCSSKHSCFYKMQHQSQAPLFSGIL